MLGDSASAAVRMAHKSILALSADIENFRFNRAVAQLHRLADEDIENDGDDNYAMPQSTWSKLSRTFNSGSKPAYLTYEALDRGY